jgi:rhodanese-related sulfurtransferase
MFEHFFRKYNKISVSELAALLDVPHKNEEGTAFIDVRRGDEWNNAHIDGFTHIALSELPLHLKELSTYKKVYFICRSGNRSEKACDMMKDIGYENAVTVTGGIVAWAEKELPLVR